jgi:putative membrane-bound dehydrogenase-like protein
MGYEPCDSRFQGKLEVAALGELTLGIITQNFMRRLSTLGALTVGLALDLAVLPGFGGQFKFATQTLTVPDGFEIELVAGSPLVNRPVSGSFDEQGRLYVTDSSGSNDKPDKQLEQKPHRVVLLEDSQGTGRFDKATVFADRMMFPEGCMWYDGALYVAAPPSIWKLTDTNHDGVADLREEWHQGKTLTGCANDLHGPYLGLDGWIYWCKGAFAAQTYELPNHKQFTSRAAHIFRARPDHSGLEPVMAGGMDNPVGLAFTSTGERILCGTFFATHEPGHRDGLIHAIYGGVYGKVNDVTDEHKKTGELMPVMTHMGPAAPCSVIRYESELFGEDFRDNLFACYFNLHKVSRHILKPDGATFKTQDSDFVTSDNPDFHPTDVIEDGDGSLIVIDTGGWYKICCPTSQLSKPDVLGAIYRVRRTGAKQVKDPRGLAIAWERSTASELARFLDDPRPAVVRQAMHRLAALKADSIPVLKEILQTSDSEDARRNAVWTLTRIDDARARVAIYSAFPAATNAHPLPNDSVAKAAICSIGLWRDRNAVNGSSAESFAATVALSDALGSVNASLRRAAAEAIGRLAADPNKDYLTARLLQTLAQLPLDRTLEHSLIYALIEINDAKATTAGLTNPATQRAALIALDQMDNGGLRVDTVAPLLASAEPNLRQTAAWVAGHHPDWGGALAGFFGSRLHAGNLTDAERAELEHQLVQFSQNSEIQKLMASELERAETSVASRCMILQAIGDCGMKEPPASWASGINASLAATDETVLKRAVAAARTVGQANTNSPNFSEALLKISKNNGCSAELRLQALAALPKGVQSVDAQTFDFLCSSVEPTRPVLTRTTAADVLAKAHLTDEQLLNLTHVLERAGPLELNRLLAAFEHSSSETVGKQLVAALKASKGLTNLRTDLISSVVSKYPEDVQADAKELLSMLNPDTSKQAAHLDELLAALKDGDIRRGQTLFNSQKAACFSCHEMGYMGGTVGPDLTSIGQVRTERDLLESIVYPSASFVRSFEPYVVKTKSDDEYNGVLRKDAPDEVILATGPGTDVRVARADIVEIRPGKVSVMPAGLDQQLTRQELADLLAFLKSTKWGPR